MYIENDSFIQNIKEKNYDWYKNNIKHNNIYLKYGRVMEKYLIYPETNRRNIYSMPEERKVPTN